MTKKYLYERDDSVANIAKREGKSRVHVNKHRRPAPEPTFDGDGYVTNATLRTIKNWTIKNNFTISDLLSYAEEAWRYKFIVRKGKTNGKQWIYIATSGWSGNEDIISALQSNRMFWIACWAESHRGGGYKFYTKPFQH